MITDLAPSQPATPFKQRMLLLSPIALKLTTFLAYQGFVRLLGPSWLSLMLLAVPVAGGMYVKFLPRVPQAD